MRQITGGKGGKITLAEKGDRLNPYGRPKKMTANILTDLREYGAQAVTPSQVAEVIAVLLNLPLDAVKKISEDKSLPILIQRTAKRLACSSDKDWDSVINYNLDRAHGKAVNKIERSGSHGGAIQFENVSDADLDKALAILEKKEGDK